MHDGRGVLPSGARSRLHHVIPRRHLARPEALVSLFQLVDHLGRRHPVTLFFCKSALAGSELHTQSRGGRSGEAERGGEKASTTEGVASTAPIRQTVHRSCSIRRRSWWSMQPKEARFSVFVCRTNRRNDVARTSRPCLITDEARSLLEFAPGRARLARRSKTKPLVEGAATQPTTQR